MSRRLVLAALAAVSAPVLGQDVVPHRGSFITTLGNETVAVETYTRTRDSLEGDIVLRVPGTTRYHYRLTFAKDGAVRTSEFAIRPMGAPRVDDQRRLTLEFDQNRVRLTSTARGEAQVAERQADPSPNVLFLGGYASSYGLYGSFGMYEHLFTRLDAADPRTTTLQVFAADTGKASPRQFRRASPTLVEVRFFKMAWMHVTLDTSGEITSADATDTTERTLTRRVEFMEIERLEKEFLALDKQGKGVGEASPNIETRATLGASSIVLKYGSPRLRGRTGVLKALIASGSVWRTGANEATTIEFNRDLNVGGSRVAAGKYSLWTMATADGAQLIINKEAGQWGMAYKPALDLVRLRVTQATVDPPLENFAIAVVTRDGAAELRIEWDTFRWSVTIAEAAARP